MGRATASAYEMEHYNVPAFNKLHSEEWKFAQMATAKKEIAKKNMEKNTVEYTESDWKQVVGIVFILARAMATLQLSD